MASIYIHIPFCHSKCYYCGFHSIVSNNSKESMIEALISELKIRKEYLSKNKIDSIYFGGGTPSIIEPEKIKNILNTINELYTISTNAEVTLEANPEDLSKEYLEEIKKIGINRLSIGIQSLYDNILSFINRRHSSKNAIDCVKLAKKIGFNNISIDLIYGIPGLDTNKWIDTLKQIEKLPITHLSSYCLSIDDNTVFKHRVEKGEFIPVSEDVCERQYNILTKWAKKNSFTHYEISNFCKDNLYSKHNTAYWQQKEYIGIGPSAHSYNISSRQWNTNNNNKYIELISKKLTSFEKEELSIIDRFNEYVMTALRTIWGIDLKYINQIYGSTYTHHIFENSKKHSKHILLKGNMLSLTEEGLFISNDIISDFFL